MNNDLILAHELASGNEEAFSKFYKETQGKVFGICYNILHSQADAEDMVQEVFMAIAKGVSKYKGDAKLSTWVHRVAVNQCLMKLRLAKHKFWSDKIDNEEDHEAIFSKLCATPSHDLNIDIRSAIKLLPPGYKNVLLLHDVEGLEHPEIVKVLGISEGTSKSQLHKARTKMKKVLNRKKNPKVASYFPARAISKLITARECSACKIPRQFGQLVSCGYCGAGANA
jgi:RNA polymerase sigma-70 factor (ECF subfamily)